MEKIADYKWKIEHELMLISHDEYNLTKYGVLDFDLAISTRIHIAKCKKELNKILKEALDYDSSLYSWYEKKKKYYEKNLIPRVITEYEYKYVLMMHKR